MQVGDTFKSNNGAGPMTARITRILETEVEMERYLGRGLPHIFRLPVWFLRDSKMCGWKPVAHRD